MPNPVLFTPFKVGALTLPNRITIAPMCTYSAENGCMNDWHQMHLGQLAQSGAGLLTIEASAVTPEGRITSRDVGLWDDACGKAMGLVLDSIRRWSDMPIAIQLAHAGRKASCNAPWIGGQAAPEDDNGWLTEAPSAIAFQDGHVPPRALDLDDLARIRRAFGDAARRSARLGIDAVQVHAAHGYLLHQFLSPLTNHRTDAYGGSLENRMRFPLEVLAETIEGFGTAGPVSVRISATDWMEGGFDPEMAIAFSRAAEAAGAAAINVSSGGNHPAQKIPVGPGYQVPLARAIKAAVGIPVVAVGLITEPAQAEAIVGTGDADLIGIARTVLYDPRWPWHAAAALGGKVRAAPQYLRCQPATLRELFTQ